MKKLVSFLILSILYANICKSQFKEYPKLTSYFSEKKYQECIDYATKQITKEPKELNPVLYCAKSYFELFKNSDEKGKLMHLKNCLKYAGRIEKMDKNKENIDRYSTFLSELHNSTLEYAAKFYDTEQKDKTKPLFEYLVKVYADTTEQYYSFYPEQRKKQEAVVGINTVKQKVNQVDSKGAKQGFWTKHYPNGSKAYEVNFKDGVPVGEYKRYNEDGKLAVFLNYDDKGEWATAKIYNDKGEVIAKGQYHGKLKHGNWTYYKDTIKTAEDNYVDGKRNGPSKVFFKNGQLCDERSFTNDVENGVWRQYYPSGKVKLETRVDNGVRNAVYYTYYENGAFETKGRYKNDAMDGEWVYFDNNGKEVQKINYKMGKADKEDELNKNENKAFRELEKNKGRFLDPADYRSNPYEYMQKNGLK